MHRAALKVHRKDRKLLSQHIHLPEGDNALEAWPLLSNFQFRNERSSAALMILAIGQPNY